MANCMSNFVTILDIGDADKLAKFHKLVFSMELSALGRLPIPQVDLKYLWWFDVYINSYTPGKDMHFGFETKWNHSVLAMVLTAREHELSFTYEYEEGDIFGEYKYDYKKDLLWHKELDPDEVGKIMDIDAQSVEQLEDMLGAEEYYQVNLETIGL